VLVLQRRQGAARAVADPPALLRALRSALPEERFEVQAFDGEGRTAREQVGGAGHSTDRCTPPCGKKTHH
jgi:hypothetical protein